MNTVEILREALQATGLNQRQLAEKYEIPLRSFEAWIGGTRTPPAYVVNLLLRCLAVDFPAKAEPVLSEQSEQQTKQSEPTYSFYDRYGKSLSPKLAELVRVEFVAGRVQLQLEQEQDFYGETVTATSKRGGKLYQCAETDLDSEIPFGLEFRVVIKEV